MLSDIPKASEVLRDLRETIGTGATIHMRDFGHGLGAVHVSFPPDSTIAITALSVLPEWDYVGPICAGAKVDDDITIDHIEFSQWVKIDTS